jgi:peroxiredoxin
VIPHVAPPAAEGGKVRRGALKSWRLYLVVFVLSFPFALVLRAVLQALLAPDLAGAAVALVRQEKQQPLSEPLAAIVSDARFVARPTQRHPLLGRPAPDFTLSDDRGNKVRLAALLGKGPAVLVFYYGYYCPHCVSQLFGLNEDVALFRELGVQLVAVSADPPADTAARFREFGRFNFAVVSDPENRVAARYGVYRPGTDERPADLDHATFLIGADGRVFWAHLGKRPFFDNKTLLVEIARKMGIAGRRVRPR